MIWNVFECAVVEAKRRNWEGVVWRHRRLWLAHLPRLGGFSATPGFHSRLLAWSYQAHKDNPIRLRVSRNSRWAWAERWTGSHSLHTKTVAWWGFIVFEFRSDPIRASQIASKGGVSSSYSTVKRGLSHRVMPFGSSYRYIKLSK